MSNDTAFRYGRLYWCVGVSSSICSAGQIYLHACRAEVKDGVLIFWSDSIGSDGGKYEARETPFQSIAFGVGDWKYFFAASVMDGHAVAVEHWQGEIYDAIHGGEAGSKRERRRERGRMDESKRYRILKRDKFTCRACGRTPEQHGVALEVDHITAVSNGGKTEDSNLQTLCRDCNHSKSDT
jgi:hypothetical protein